MESVITQIIAEQLDVPKNAVVAEAPILEGLAADSLDTVYLILTIEEKFGIAISDVEASTLKTVSDIYNIVSQKCRLAWSLHQQHAS